MQPAELPLTTDMTTSYPSSYHRLCGATVARLTPDQKVACSNHVRVRCFDCSLKSNLERESDLPHKKKTQTQLNCLHSYAADTLILQLGKETRTEIVQMDRPGASQFPQFASTFFSLACSTFLSCPLQSRRHAKLQGNHERREETRKQEKEERKRGK